MRLRQEWRPRILSNLLASWTMGLAAPAARTPQGRLAAGIGIWTLGWFLVVSAIVVFCFPDRALLYLFGCYCGLAFDYMPTYNSRTYPWDLPSLALFTLFIALLAKSRLKALMALVPIGMLFKETSVVLAIALLFLPGSRTDRLRRFGLVVLACLAVKVAVDALVGGPLILSMTVQSPGPAPVPRLLHNLVSLVFLYRPWFLHPVLVNAGTFAALLCLPNRSNEIRTLKTIAVAFAIGIFVFGRITEYRVWFEMIPLSLYGLDLASRRTEPIEAAVIETVRT